MLRMYRAKRVDGGSWIEGNLVNIRGRHYIISPFDDPDDLHLICVLVDTIEEIVNDRLMSEMEKLKKRVSNLEEKLGRSQRMISVPWSYVNEKIAETK